MRHHTDAELCQIMERFHCTREEAEEAPYGVLDCVPFTEQEIEALCKDPYFIDLIERINNGTQVPIATIDRKTTPRIPKVSN